MKRANKFVKIMSGGENILCFVDRSDPGRGGLCGNMDRGISAWGEEAMTGRRKKRAGNKTIQKCQKTQSRDRGK